jgi:hypothetical protein
VINQPPPPNVQIAIETLERAMRYDPVENWIDAYRLALQWRSNRPAVRGPKHVVLIGARILIVGTLITAVLNNNFEFVDYPARHLLNMGWLAALLALLAWRIVEDWSEPPPAENEFVWLTRADRAMSYLRDLAQPHLQSRAP